MYILVMHCIWIVYQFHSDGSDSVRWYTNREPLDCVPDTTCSLCTGHIFTVNVLDTVLQSMYWTQFCNLWTGHLSAVYVLEMYLAVSELDTYLQYWTYICSLSTGHICSLVLDTDLHSLYRHTCGDSVLAVYGKYLNVYRPIPYLNRLTVLIVK